MKTSDFDPSKVRFRKSVSGDNRGIVSLMTLCFDTETQPELLSPDYWKWKYEQNVEGKSAAYVVTDAEKLIGHYGFLPIDLSYRGNQVRTMIAVDAAISPPYRRKRLFFAMSKFALDALAADGITLLIGFTASTRDSTVMPAHRKVGWLCPFKIQVYGKPLNSAAVAKAKFGPGVVSRFASVGLRILSKTILRWKAYSGTEYVVKEIRGFDPELEDFLMAAGRDYVFAHTRSRSFLSWRFLRNPRKNYSFFVAEREGRIVGFMVLRSFDYLDMRSILIVDLVTLKNDEPAIEMLLDWARKISNQLDADMIACMTNDRGIIRLLRRKGFIGTGERYNFIVNPINNEIPINELQNIDNWFLTWSDFDVM